MRRYVLFLGFFSILLLVLLGISAALVQAGSVRTPGHWALGWAAMVPMGAYLILSLRELLKR